MAEATEKLASSVEKARPDDLVEIYDELFPGQPSVSPPQAAELVQHIRHGLEPDEVVDLWHVVFPRHRKVWYDEEEETINFNDESLRYLD
jgi:hypothetical protein